MIKNLIKLANLFLKFAEKTYNCRHCGAPHKAVDPSGFMCGQCGTTTYPNRAKKNEQLKQIEEKHEEEIEEENDIEEPEKIKEKKILPSHQGGYPIIYVLERTGDYLCNKCAGTSDEDYDGKLLSDVYWEGPTVYCDGCNAEIESAYGDPDDPSN